MDRHLLCTQSTKVQSLEPCECQELSLSTETGESPEHSPVWPKPSPNCYNLGAIEVIPRVGCLPCTHQAGF